MKVDLSEMINALDGDKDVSMSRTKNGKYTIFVTASEVMADKMADAVSSETETLKPENKGGK